MARKKRTWRWVTRDNEYSLAVLVHESAIKPVLSPSGKGWKSQSGCNLITIWLMAEVIGIDIQPGECLKVEFGAAKIIGGREGA